MTRLVRVTAVLLTAVAVTGCWPAPGAGPDRRSYNAAETGITADSVGALGLLWEAQLDDGPAGDPVTSVRGGVHVADTRAVYALAPATGARRWRRGVAAPLEVTPPYVRGDEVLTGQWDPTADAATRDAREATLRLDAATGAPVDLTDGSVPAAQRGSWVLTWRNSWFPTPQGFTFWAMYLGVHDLDAGGPVCCPGAYGLIGPDAPRSVPPLTLASEWIVVAGDGLLSAGPNPVPPVGGNGVRGYSIAAPIGPAECLGLYLCPTWATATDGTNATAPVLTDDQATAYTATDAGTVYAVRTADGTVLWSTPVGSAVTAPPALANGVLFVPTAADGLVAVDAATGAVLWSGSTGGGAVTEQPAVAGPAGHAVVLAGTTGGSVQAFPADGCGAATCTAAWSYAAGDAVTGAPAVSNGRLYVGTEDGRVLAFGVSN
jgi:outer membrane protein assembly factor BamB